MCDDLRCVCSIHLRWWLTFDEIRGSLISTVMKIAWLITDLTVVEAPARAESAVLWLILDVHRTIQALSGHVCGQGASL